MTKHPHFITVMRLQRFTYLVVFILLLTSCRFPLLPRGAEETSPGSNGQNSSNEVTPDQPTGTPTPQPTSTPTPQPSSTSTNIPTSTPTRITVPNVTGMTVSEANDPLNVAGLRGGQVSQTEYSEVIEAGRIIRSEPAAGEKTDPDTWVALIVSDGPEPLQLPPRVVQGRVLWNETPVEDAAVYARDEYSGDSTLFGQSVTDAQGWFEITGIPAGEQYLYVHGSGPEYWVSVVTPFTMASDRGSEVDDTYLCKGFTPISPIDGSVAATDRTVLKWEPFPDAVDYAARVTKVGESNFSFQKGDSDARINDTEIQVTPNLSPGDYRWRVDAFNSKGHMIGCSYYDKGRFTIPQQSHTPVISHVLRREESDNGQRIIYQDIYFTDLGGDAFLVAYELVSTTKAGIIVENDPITASSEEQKIGAFVTGTWKCGGGSYIVTLRATILDQAGNTSNPVEIVFDCN